MRSFTPKLCPINALAVLAILISGLLPSFSNGMDQPSHAAAAKAKLAAVRAHIAALTMQLSTDLKTRDALNARVRDADLDITAKRRRLDDIQSAVLAAERRRDKLSGQRARAQSALDAERSALSAQVRAAYLIGGQAEIKLLLNQSDAGGAGRMAAYYGYFARERAHRIEAVDRRVSRLQELVRESDTTTGELRSLRTDAVADLQELQQARVRRIAALAAASQQVSGASQELEKLRREEQAEEALVADLARVLQDFPVDTQVAFASLRGKLPWPVAGRLLAMRRNGVLIEAMPGAKVRAPFFGRVVYADWLQGMGLLLIVGHDSHYMTLYGHAEVLYKSVGDWVAPGDVIAGLSDSVGAAPQLFFEIRDGRTPVDARTWLKAKP